MELLIELPKEFEEHFDFDKFQDSFMRIGGCINKIRKSHSQPWVVSLVLSGKYEHGLVDILKNAFLNAKKVKGSIYQIRITSMRGFLHWANRTPTFCTRYREEGE